MKKNYQIPLCKKCWEINYSKDAEECFFFSEYVPKPFTKSTAREGKEPLINDKKNTCRFFLDRKKMEGKGRGPTWRDKEDTRIANKRTYAAKVNSFIHGFGWEK